MWWTLNFIQLVLIDFDVKSRALAAGLPLAMVSAGGQNPIVIVWHLFIHCLELLGLVWFVWRPFLTASVAGENIHATMP